MTSWITGRQLRGLLAVAALFVLMTATARPASAEPIAICVPWLSSYPTIPHFTYSGAATTVKGIARGDAVEYRWDYGDGTGMPWTAIANSYNLGQPHVYAGPVDRDFIATLFVRNASGVLHSDTYRVRIHESSDLSINEHLDVRVNMAIDAGLWWLHCQMQRANYPSGSPGYGQPYGYWTDTGGYPLAATGTSVDAFQLHGSKPNGDYDGDPYVETVQRALNYLLYNTYSYSIAPQTHGDPDFDPPGPDAPNGIGLVTNHSSSVTDSRQTYIGGICMLAFAASEAPNIIAQVGGPNVYGRSYGEIVQDMVDFFAWGQIDSGSGRGGWRYYANYSGSDMSTTQWPPLGMIYAEKNMDAVIPQFVRDELINFLDYTQHTACDNDNGAFGYADTSTYLNCTKAAAGIICHEFLGTPRDNPKVASAFGFLYRHWNDAGTGWDDTKLHGNSYGMYGVMKAMRIPEPHVRLIHNFDCSLGIETEQSFDWYYTPIGQSQQGLATYNVIDQHADGSWDDSVGPNAVYDAFCTGWRVLTLQEAVGIPQPVAIICDCQNQIYEKNQTVQLNGTCSTHQDYPRRTIAEYLWDFDYDGEFNTEGVGAIVTKPGGYPAIGNYTVALRVRDDNPNETQTDETYCTVIVKEPPHCPNAFAQPDPNQDYAGWVGVPIQLDGSMTWDPNNDPMIFEWDYDYGDVGTFGVPDATGPTPWYTCTTTGIEVIAMRVCDLPTAYDQCCREDYAVVDCDNHPPQCEEFAPVDATTNSTVHLCAPCYDIDPGDQITFAWDTNATGNFDDATGRCIDFEIPVDARVGDVYVVCVKVSDNFNEYEIACLQVRIVNYIETAHPGWNWFDVAVTLTPDEPTYWSASTGQPLGVQPFMALDAGQLPGRPDPEGTGQRVLRGYIVAWAVNSEGEEIRWNHLQGQALTVNYLSGAAWEHNTYAFQAIDTAAAHGDPTGTPGVLNLDGVEYQLAYDQLLLDFYAVDSTALSSAARNTLVDTDLTLLPVTVDLRQESDGPVTTKAHFDIWDMNEFKKSGTYRCVTCWDQTLLRNYDIPNNFLIENLWTDKGKARIDGLASQYCDVDYDPADGPLGADPRDVISVSAPLLGVVTKGITFGEAPDAALSGVNLVGLGSEPARVQADLVSGGNPPPESPGTGGAVNSAALSQVVSRESIVLAPHLASGVPRAATGTRVNASQKGSLLIYPDVELRWDASGNLVQDVFLTLTNDYPDDVIVQMYYINGDPPIDAP